MLDREIAVEEEMKTEKAWVIKTKKGEYLLEHWDYTPHLHEAWLFQRKKDAIETIKDGGETAKENGEHVVKVEIKEISDDCVGVKK